MCHAYCEQGTVLGLQHSSSLKGRCEMEWADPCHWSRGVVLRPGRRTGSSTAAASFLREQEHLSDMHSELSRGSPVKAELMQAQELKVARENKIKKNKIKTLICNGLVHLCYGLSKGIFFLNNIWLFLVISQNPQLWSVEPIAFFPTFNIFFNLEEKIYTHPPPPPLNYYQP